MSKSNKNVLQVTVIQRAVCPQGFQSLCCHHCQLDRLHCHCYCSSLWISSVEDGPNTPSIVFFIGISRMLPLRRRVDICFSGSGSTAEWLGSVGAVCAPPSWPAHSVPLHMAFRRRKHSLQEWTSDSHNYSWNVTLLP